MKTHKPFIPTLIILALVMGACRFLRGGASDTPETTDGAQVMTYDRLLAALQEADAIVEATGEITQPFFPVPGKRIQVNGSEVQVFEFGDANASREAAESVSSSGTMVGTTSVSWLATPHFYKTDNVIAIYVGEDPAVMKLLEGILGAQFAGG